MCLTGTPFRDKQEEGDEEEEERQPEVASVSALRNIEKIG